MKDIFAMAINLAFLTLIMATSEVDPQGEQKESFPTDCRPFGTRLSWGQLVVNPSSEEKLQIRFNTHKKCSNLGVILDSGVKVGCEVSQRSKFQMIFDSQMISFTHICSLSSEITFGQQFSYNLFFKIQLNQHFSQNIKVNLKDPRNINTQFKFVHLADWGKVDRNSYKYPLIQKTLGPMARNGDFDTIIVNGDLAYDLNLEIHHHRSFMHMLEQIAKYVPVIFNRGNHQYGEAGNIFCQYFHVYNLCQRNATALSVGPAYLALFDPQAALIPRLFHLYTQEERLSSNRNLDLDLEQGSKSGRTVIALSHYPLVCSYPSIHHCIPHERYNEFTPLYVNLQDHYNTILNKKVPLVLTGHIHTYERTHKLLRGYRYQKTAASAPITFDRSKDEFFVHVVSGVAGSDTLIFDEYARQGVQYKVQPYVASYNLKTVGFGLMTVSKHNIEYKHFGISLDNRVRLLDDFQIQIKGNRFNPTPTESEQL